MPEKVTLVVFSGEMDKVIPAFNIAIGAASFATGDAVYYSATHPGGSFDRTEYLSTVFNWAVWGAAAGATAYMAPGLVGYGLSMAGTDAIGTAVWPRLLTWRGVDPLTVQPQARPLMNADRHDNPRGGGVCGHSS